MTCWVYNYIRCLDDDLVVVGGTGYALGIVVGCITC